MNLTMKIFKSVSRETFTRASFEELQSTIIITDVQVDSIVEEQLGSSLVLAFRR